MIKLLNNTSYVLSLLLIFTFTQSSYAQCDIENNYFQSGETMEYDLYFKFGLIYTKAGYGSLKTQSTTYNGQEAYKMALISASQGVARKAFKLNDTLACYTTKALVPLAFTKYAHEGDEHTIEKYKYTYAPNNTVKINTVRNKNGVLRFDDTLQSNQCTYDMISVVYYARTLDYQKMKAGDKTSVSFVSGRKKVNMKIVYEQKENVKMNDGNTYKCIKLNLLIEDDAFQDKEAMKVYITDDNNRMPVRIETKLKIGSTRAVLKSYKGNKHPVALAK